MSQDLIANLANAFEPVPLPTGSDLYSHLAPDETKLQTLFINPRIK